MTHHSSLTESLAHRAQRSPEVAQRAHHRSHYVWGKLKRVHVKCSLCLSLCLSLWGRMDTACAAPPSNRMDLSTSYTLISVGDWQSAVVSYNRQWSKRWNVGVISRYLRRDFNGEVLSDFGLSIPVYYQNDGQFSLNAQVDMTPLPQISPRYAAEVTPNYRLSKLPFTLSTRYRYAQYSRAFTHLVRPGVLYHHARFSLGLYAYVIFPEFGPNSLTPQARLRLRITPSWYLSWWSTYGYETLNERFVDPARQSVQWGNFVRLSHFFSDTQGVNLGANYIHFLSDDPIIAQEIFNQNRFESSLHYFVRF